jgi:cell wall-associated NlpC family hydrolase
LAASAAERGVGVSRMQQDSLGVLLDEGGRDLARLLGGIAVGGFLALLLAVVVPIVLLARMPGLVLQAGTQLSLTAVQAGAQFVTGAFETSGRAEQAQPVGRAVGVARQYLGVPYVFGGTNPRTGLDCSGLVQLVYRELGISLPRTAQQQFDATERVARDQLQPGDLVFFARTYAAPMEWITHVGIYVGDGNQINAPTPGQVVSIQPVFSGFWGAHFVSCGRVRGAAASSLLTGERGT